MIDIEFQAGGYWLARLGSLGLVLALLFGVWALGGYWIRDNGWFCGMRNGGGTTVALPPEPVHVDEFERFVADQSGCASLTPELTVSGVWPPQTVIAPIGRSVSFVGGDPILARLEVTPRDFWLECGDFTGHRAGNFPDLDFSHQACDPAIETRCMSDNALVLCAEIGNRGQRCLSADGHVTLACGDEANICLATDGRFITCEP